MRSATASVLAGDHLIPLEPPICMDSLVASCEAPVIRVGEVPGSDPGGTILQGKSAFASDRTRTSAVPRGAAPATPTRML